MNIALALLVVVMVGCTTPTPGVTPVPCPSAGIDASSLPRAAEQPRPVELFIPPLPIPTGVLHRRATIRVVVDTVGRVMTDSVTVCGIPDAEYSRRVASAAAGVRFVPRRGAGGPVVAATILVYDF